MSYAITTPSSTHVAEKVNGGFWISRLEDRTHTTSGRPRGWRFILGGNGTSRYLLRMEDGAMVARTYKVVPVETSYGDRSIRPTSKVTVIDDTLPENGHVVVVGNRIAYLTWFGGKAEYTGSNIDGGVIHKAYVSSKHRRKGVATALLDFARQLFPDEDIRHSDAPSADGAAFAAATPTPNDLPRRRAAAA